MTAPGIQRTCRKLGSLPVPTPQSQKSSLEQQPSSPPKTQAPKVEECQGSCTVTQPALPKASAAHTPPRRASASKEMPLSVPKLEAPARPPPPAVAQEDFTSGGDL